MSRSSQSTFTRPGTNGARRRHRPSASPLFIASLVLLALGMQGLGCGGDVEARMAEVRALQDVGQFTESIDQLREILALAPDLPEANYRMGVALVQTGEPSRAVWALQKASESPEYAIVAGLLLANAHFNIKNYEEAVRATNRVLEIDPDRLVALQIRAKALLGAHRPQEALVDSRRLVELAPDDLTNRIVHATILMDVGEMEEAEQEHLLVKEMGAKSEDPESAARACLAPALFYKDAKKDLDRAEELYRDCVESYPTDPFIVSHVMTFLDRRDKPEEATLLIEKAVELAPENLSLRASLANRLSSRGDTEGAEKVLVEAAETFGSATAWNILATFYRREGNPEKALAAIDKVMELTGGGGDQLRFTKADLLIDKGDCEEAAEVASALDEAVYETLIRGRIELTCGGDPEAALAAFDKGIRHWPNNPGARYLAGIAARETGDFERAITELRESVRADPTATDAAYALAHLYAERREYKQCANFAQLATRRRRGGASADAYRVAAQCYTELGQYDIARAAIEKLQEMDGQEDKALTALAALAEKERGPEASVEMLLSREIDLSSEANESALRTLVENLTELGRVDEALARVETALGTSDRASLHALRGNLLNRLGRSDESRKALERAIEIDSTNAEAWAGLAILAGNEEDYAKAVELFDRATELDPNTPHFAYSAAQLTLAQGKQDEAEKRLREIVKLFPGEAAPRNDLAWVLAEQEKDLDFALTLAQEASQIEATPEILDTLGFVQLALGDSEAAVATLEKALEKAGDSPSIRYRLGTALEKSGQVERARAMLRQALDAGSFPEKEAAERKLAQLEKP